MSGITTGTGLISGLDIAGIIDQLIAIESRPKQLVERQNAVLQSQQVAYQDINSKLLSLKLSAEGFSTESIFNAASATSSNESVLTASASSGAVPGNYAFSVQQLVSSQQTITKGFLDTESSNYGDSTFTFERGEARLDSKTLLSNLNGGEGIARGKVRITDRSGASAVVDLSTVVTADDVIERINNASGINVIASIDGDGFKLTDTTGQTASNLVVANVGTSTTATSLGLAGSAASDELVGQQINTLGDSTLLTSLNDGNGISIKDGVADLQITTAAGGTFAVDLTDAVTLDDVFTAISDATAGDVTAAVGDDGVSVKLTDNTGGGAGFTVTAMNDSTAAADFGILGSDGDGDGDIAGQRIIAGINTKLLKHLGGGTGVGLGTIAITNRSGATTNIDLSGATSIADVMTAINDSGANVTASLNQAGNGLLLTDTTGGTNDLIVADVSGTAAVDLNLAGTFTDDVADSGNLQFQYITEATRIERLGITRGKFTITDSTGAQGTVDLTQGDEVTIGDVIKEINSRGLGINARINDTGDGILIEDTAGGSVKMKIEEAGSTTAKDLGLLGEVENPGDNIDGSFEKTIDITASDTLTDIAQKINDAKIGISAAIINDGSPGAPYRLIFSAKDSGTDGAFVFDDGDLDFGANTLSEARDAVVFFGSSDPANALVITSKSNTLKNVIPGATVDLKATTTSPVQVTVSRDNSKVVTAVKGFVDKYNALITSIEQYDSYDAETKQRGLLLGDSTLTAIRRSIQNSVIGRNTDLSSQFQSLSQVGVKMASGAKLELDEAKLQAALDTDRDGVINLFTFKETEEDEVTGETTITSSGVGVEIAELLKRLTDVENGSVQTRVDAIDRQIALNQKRIDDLNERLEDKRARLQAQFNAMESALASMQQQSQALASFQPVAVSSSNKSQ